MIRSAADVLLDVQDLQTHFALPQGVLKAVDGVSVTLAARRTQGGVGESGAGKSVLLAMMALSFRRYANAQIFAFDFGGSIRAATLAMGGRYHDLGGGAVPSSAHSEKPRMPRSKPVAARPNNG